MSTEQATIRPYGPGKFYTILDEYAYSLDPDEQESYDDGGGCYLLLRGPIEYVADPETGPELNSAEIAELTSSAGIILFERSDGIVESTWYDSAKALETGWSRVQAAFETDDGESDD